MTDEVHGEEAAWRELVARLTAPAGGEGTPPPWPAREGLPVSPAADGDGEDEPSAGAAAGGRPPGRAPQAEESQPSPSEPERRRGDPAAPARGDPIPGVMPAPPQIRVVRPAAPVPRSVGDDTDDDHYVPPPPPPLPRLDPVSKGAWAALFGGPGYLLLAIMLGWVVPGWAAFCAVGAFVGGFATLVVRLGDRPPPGSGPDNGAVV